MRIDSNQEFSNVGYAFLMFLTDYYKRVGKLKLTFDEMMVLNTVAAQLAYNLKFSVITGILTVLTKLKIFSFKLFTPFPDKLSTLMIFDEDNTVPFIIFLIS